MKRNAKRVFVFILFLMFLHTTLTTCKKAAIFEDIGTAPIIHVADNPLFNYDSGTYLSAILVTITSDVSATIKYTIDGSNPTISGTVITAASPISIIVGSNMTISAYAQKTDYRDSSVITKVYVINAIGTSDPAFLPIGASYTANVTVTLTCLTPGAIIRYTTDGSDPASSGTAATYAVPIFIASTKTVKAFAYKAGLTDSNTVSQTYTIVAPGTVATPTITPAGGIKDNDLTGGNQVVITTTTAGASIYYTTDGSNPTIASTLYTVPFNLTGNITTATDTVVKAFAVKAAMTDSAIANQTYQFNVAAVSIAPPGGNYATDQTVTLSTATTGAQIYYTTNGAIPTIADTLYSAPIPVLLTGSEIRAKAFKAGYTASAASANQTYTYTVADPVINTLTGTYYNDLNVSISTTTAGAQIYYTTNGNIPTTSDNLYIGVILINSTGSQLRAKAFKPGYTDSGATANQTYTMTAAAPILSVLGGTYTTDQTVTMSTTTTGSQIYYTTNGAVPTTSDNLYIGAILINATGSQLRTKTFKLNYTASADSGNQTYTLNCSPTGVFIPNSGTFTASVNVDVSSTTIGSTIYYTTDGSPPIALISSSIANPGTITVNASTTGIKTLVYKIGYANSGIQTSGTFTILPTQVVAPVITPAGATNANQILITMSTTTPGASIYYTFDDTAPTIASTLYAVPFMLNSNQTPPGNTFTKIRAFAFKAGFTSSVEGTPVIHTFTTNFPTTPSITPGGGNYSNNQSVTMSTTTVGAQIYYTTNGAVPTAADNLYGGAITISINGSQLRAIAIRAGYNDSAVSANQIYNLKAATPVFSVGGGSYTSDQSVTLSTTTIGAQIYYRTDGGIPSAADTLYSGAISVTSSMQIRAIAVKANYADSDPTANQVYTLTAAIPTFSAGTGTYSANQNVIISSTTAGAQIYYTTNGAVPTTSDNLYSGAIPISITGSQLRAFAVKVGYNNSAATVNQVYTLTVADPAPVISPITGTYYSNQTVSVGASATPGSQIYYRLDGTNPTTADTLYSAPFVVSVNAQVRMRAFKTDYNSSAILSSDIALRVADPAPVISPVSGTYGSNQTVSVGASATPGSQIYYRLDGINPTTADTLYSAPFVVSASAQVRMRAFKTGYTPSNVLSSDIILKAADPTYSISGGTFNSAQSITLSIITSGAVIRYTTDGSAPDGASPIYSGAINVTVNTTIKAIGVKAGWTTSNTVSETYNIRVSTPAFAPGTGTYSPSVDVFMSCSTSGAAIYYTTDGSSPNSGSTLYSGSILVNTTGMTTIKAIAIKAGMADSLIMTNEYTIP